MEVFRFGRCDFSAAGYFRILGLCVGVGVYGLCLVLVFLRLIGEVC